MVGEGPRVLGCAKPGKWAPLPSLPQFPCTVLENEGISKACRLTLGIFPPQRAVLCLPLSCILGLRPRQPGRGRQSRGCLWPGARQRGPSHVSSVTQPSWHPCGMRPTLNISKLKLQGVGVTSGSHSQ